MQNCKNEKYVNQAVEKLAEIEEYIYVLPQEVSHWVSNLADETDAINMVKSVIFDLEESIKNLKAMIGA